MKRKLITLIMILLCFIAQAVFWDLFPLGNVKPDLLLILTVSMGLMRGKHTGIWVGFISGLAIDIFYGSLFGFNALVYMYIGYFNGKFNKVFFEEDVKIPMMMTFVSGFAYNIVIYAARFLFGQKYNYIACITHIILPEIIYTVICTLLLYRLFYNINRKLVADELEEADSPWLLK